MESISSIVECAFVWVYDVLFGEVCLVNQHCRTGSEVGQKSIKGRLLV